MECCHLTSGSLKLLARSPVGFSFRRSKLYFRRPSQAVAGPRALADGLLISTLRTETRYSALPSSICDRSSSSTRISSCRLLSMRVATWLLALFFALCALAERYIIQLEPVGFMRQTGTGASSANRR